MKDMLTLPIRKKTKSSKKQLSEQDMIDKLTKLGYNITLQNT